MTSHLSPELSFDFLSEAGSYPKKALRTPTSGQQKMVPMTEFWEALRVSLKPTSSTTALPSESYE